MSSDFVTLTVRMLPSNPSFMVALVNSFSVNPTMSTARTAFRMFMNVVLPVPFLPIIIFTSSLNSLKARYLPQNPSISTSIILYIEFPWSR
ncbi:hypothetical protein D9M69_500780 [compost metagenome]